MTRTIPVSQLPHTSTYVSLARVGGAEIVADAEAIVLAPEERWVFQPYHEIAIRDGDEWGAYVTGPDEVTVTGPLVFMRPRKIDSIPEFALKLYDIFDIALIIPLLYLLMCLAAIGMDYYGFDVSLLGLAIFFLSPVLVFYAIHRIVILYIRVNPGQPFKWRTRTRRIDFLAPTAS